MANGSLTSISWVGWHWVPMISGPCELSLQLTVGNAQVEFGIPKKCHHPGGDDCILGEGNTPMYIRQKKTAELSLEKLKNCKKKCHIPSSMSVDVCQFFPITRTPTKPELGLFITVKVLFEPT